MRAVAVVSVCVLVACGRIGFDGIADGGAAGSDAVIDGGVFVGATATYVKASNTGADDAFGSAIAMSGDGQTLAITAYAEASSAGGVGPNQNDNTAAGAGAVYVFVRIAGGWSQQAYIKAPDPDAGDTFGSSVALSRDGNLLAIGALGEDGSGLGVNPANDENRIDSGAAYLYRRSGTTWAFETYVKATNTGAGDAFGQAVALSGDGATLVVSAPGEDSNGRGVGASQTDNNASNAGAAYVYIQRQAGWAPVAYLKASNTSDGDQFGDAIAISDDGSTIAVGAYFEASGETGIDPSGADESSLGAGAVYVFAGTGDSWVQQAYVKAPNTDAGDQFGSSVALTANGSILVVGAHLEDSGARGVNGSQSNGVSEAGAAYVLERSGDAWTHRAYLKASNTAADYNFGLRSSISGDGSQIAIGAINEASGSAGVGGDDGDMSMFGAGAAYVFSRGADTRSWTQRAYVKAITPDMLDNFATVVLSSDGRTLVVGAYLEDSMATGIDGDSTNDGRVNSGAAYIYE